MISKPTTPHQAVQNAIFAVEKAMEHVERAGRGHYPTSWAAISRAWSDIASVMPTTHVVIDNLSEFQTAMADSLATPPPRNVTDAEWETVMALREGRAKVTPVYGAAKYRPVDLKVPSGRGYGMAPVRVGASLYNVLKAAVVRASGSGKHTITFPNSEVSSASTYDVFVKFDSKTMEWTVIVSDMEDDEDETDD